MQKIKNLLHHNADANHNGIPDSQERVGTTSTSAHRGPIVHDHGTTLPNTIVTPGTAATTSTTSALNNDRNMNGIPDNLEGRSARHNPLDKNMDGKVGLSDFLPGANRKAALNDRNGNGIPDSQERLGGMSNDLNGNGIPDSLERNRLGGFSNDRNMNGIPDNLERTSYSSSSTFSNDRNMNGIPDNLEYSSGSASYVRSAPTHVEVIEKGVVVHEHIHPVEKEEIQPIIYREREQMEVKQITQQLHETQIQPTLVQQRELAAEVRAPVIQRGAPIQENLVLPSVDRDATMRSVQVNQAIVNETIKRTVIEEVQPVLERDVFAPTIIQETLPIYEKIVEAPTVYRETLATRELGTRGYQAPIVQQAPIVRETFVPAPVVQQAPLIQPVTMTTTTTTTDSFIPAKLVHEGELRGTNTHAAPTHRKLF